MSYRIVDAAGAKTEDEFREIAVFGGVPDWLVPPEDFGGTAFESGPKHTGTSAIVRVRDHWRNFNKRVTELNKDDGLTAIGRHREIVKIAGATRSEMEHTRHLAGRLARQVQAMRERGQEGPKDPIMRLLRELREQDIRRTITAADIAGVIANAKLADDYETLSAVVRAPATWEPLKGADPEKLKEIRELVLFDGDADAFSEFAELSRIAADVENSIRLVESEITDALGDGAPLVKIGMQDDNTEQAASA
ncbi:hypothetical protein [Oceanibacterium hippocampi]|uniref:Uncharacterized protein n=1 Tax=Oceanibacterium hippocampi TaxID=745714 RepID=A0A1Y5U344_9PROT|nr:hypothetical protein [Oceanibacterium hippocampi]SLN77376.1 hypothetical protein OCH7691_04393 [Oceanibacterium hippocampi]